MQLAKSARHRIKARLEVLFLLMVSLGLGLEGCSSPKPVVRAIPIQAEVMQVDQPGKMLMIKHGDIPGFMPAMTMGYAVVSPRDLQGLQPGDNISANLLVADGFTRLEKITKIKKPDAVQPASTVVPPAH